MAKEDPFSEGYTEALKDCSVLAVNLLSLAINGETIKRCWDCSDWVGQCAKGKVWRIARDEACSEFSPKKRKGNDNAKGQ
jgi:hypothetical protein